MVWYGIDRDALKAATIAMLDKLAAGMDAGTRTPQLIIVDRPSRAWNSDVLNE